MWDRAPVNSERSSASDLDSQQQTKGTAAQRRPFFYVPRFFCGKSPASVILLPGKKVSARSDAYNGPCKSEDS